jgi:hypothetical protein
MMPDRLEEMAPDGSHPEDPIARQYAHWLPVFAERHGLQPSAVRDSRHGEATRARHELWWHLRKRGASLAQLGRLAGRNIGTVREAMLRFSERQ